MRKDKNVLDFYRMSKMLGAGTFGEVWNSVQRETGAHRAIKKIKIEEEEKEGNKK